MFHLVNLYRIPTYYGRFPTLEELIPSLVISTVRLATGWWAFSNKSDEIAYRI